MPQLTQAQIDARLRQKFGNRSARTGGKGAVRRKYKAPSKSSTTDDKRLNTQLKRLNVSQIPAIEEVNLFKEDGTVVHFTKPRVQAEIASNTYVVSGTHETKKLEELIPEILPQLGGESIKQLKHFANTLNQMNPDMLGDADVPTLVDENFEEFSRRDEKSEETKDVTENKDEQPSDKAEEDNTKPGDTVSSAATQEASQEQGSEVQAEEQVKDSQETEAQAPDTNANANANADTAEQGKEDLESANVDDVPDLVPATAEENQEQTSLEPDNNLAISV